MRGEMKMKELTNEELIETHKYYKERKTRLGKDEYNYLIELEREMNRRKIGIIKEIKMVIR